MTLQKATVHKQKNAFYLCTKIWRRVGKRLKRFYGEHWLKKKAEELWEHFPDLTDLLTTPSFLKLFFSVFAGIVSAARFPHAPLWTHPFLSALQAYLQALVGIFFLMTWHSLNLWLLLQLPPTVTCNSQSHSSAIDDGFEIQVYLSIWHLHWISQRYFLREESIIVVKILRIRLTTTEHFKKGA